MRRNLIGSASPSVNLTETDISKFKGDTAGLHDAIRLAAGKVSSNLC